MRWFVLIAALALWSTLATAPAAAQDIAGVDVPVSVATPAATTTAPASASPQPLPSSIAISQSDWSFQNVPAAQWLDNLAAQLFDAFANIINTSVRLAQYLFYTLAVCEFGWSAARWAFSSTPMEEVVMDAYVKAIRLGLLYVVIGCTFQLPGGAPGWFPAIVGGIITMAEDASGVSVFNGPFAVNGTLNLTAGFSPGDVFTFFWNIATFVLKAAFFQQSLGTILVGAFTGATGLWLVTVAIAVVSGVGILLLGLYVSFKFFQTLLKAYLIASQAYLQGFLGSSLTASNGAGLFNAALNLGIEAGALVVVIGVFKAFLTLCLSAMNLGFLTVQNATANYGPVGIVMQSWTGEGLRIVAILIIDVFVAGWAYLVKTVPEAAAASLSGRLDVRPEEFLAHARAGFTPTKLAGAAASVATGALGVRMLSSSGGGGAATFADRARGAATGALQGALFAGGGGAVGGAFMGAVRAPGPVSTRDGAAGAAGGASASSRAGGVTTGTSASSGESTDGDHAAGGVSDGPATDRGPAGAGEVPSEDTAAPVGPADARADGTGPQPADPSAPDAHGDQPASVSGSGAEQSADPRPAATGGEPAATGAAEEPSGGSTTSMGGSNNNATSAKGGNQQGSRRGSAQDDSDNDDVMRDLASALRDNTDALRAHRFGGGRSGASGGTGGGGAPGSDPIFGGGPGTMNPLNVMLYRQLLNLGGGRAPAVRPEHPAAAIDHGTLVR